MELLSRLLDKVVYTAGTWCVVVTATYDKEPSCATIPNNECQALYNSKARHSVVCMSDPHAWLLPACVSLCSGVSCAEIGARCMWPLSACKASSRGLV